MNVRTIMQGALPLCLSIFIMGTTTVYGTDSTFAGIDVSDYQGTIDFTQVQESGIEAVYIRVASGGDYEDSQWARNYQQATAAGLTVGFYHYVDATTAQEAKDQAQYFYSFIQNHTVDFYPAMDYEPNTDTDTANAIAKAYLEELATLTGDTVVIYSDVSRIESLWDSDLSQYPLWVADYDVSAPSSTGDWSSWAGFQYSDSGSVDGIDGAVDLDTFGSTLLYNSSTTANTTISSPATYTVVSGNTLWGIARTYDTTVGALVSLNDIANPDYILPGQVLVLG